MTWEEVEAKRKAKIDALTPEQRDVLTKREQVPPEAIAYFARVTKGKTPARAMVEFLEETVGGEILVRTIALANTKKHGFQAKEVVRRMTGTECFAARSLEYRPVAGWVVDYEDESEPYGVYADKTLRMEHKVVNEDMLEGLDAWRWHGKITGNAWEYLQAFRQDRAVEYFGKMGLAPSRCLITKAKKDGQFRRFLQENAGRVRAFNCRAILYAYKHKTTLDDAWEITYRAGRLMHQYAFDWYENRPPKGTLDFCRLAVYLPQNAWRTYVDYISACVECGVALTESVLYPRDLYEAHDLRVMQADAHRRKLAENERQAFAERCEQLRRFETVAAGYCIMLPVTAQDLTKEGDALNHCVGRMGYDRKVVNGKSMIAFMRLADAKEVPLYTIEYDLERLRVVQAHGKNNISLPDDAEAILEKWAEGITATLKKEKRTATAQ